MPAMRLAAAGLLSALALLITVPAAMADNARYALANGCYDLTAGGQPADAGTGPFRMKATALGSYMLYTKSGQYLAKTGASTAGTAATPSDQADWTVDGTTGAFTVTLPAAKQQL